MSIFGSIVSAIFGHASAAGTTAGSSVAPTSPAASSAAATPMARADVEAMIAKLAAGQDEDYNWKQSIVDLMKLLKLDSSLTARKQLAQELGHDEARRERRQGARESQARVTSSAVIRNIALG